MVIKSTFPYFANVNIFSSHYNWIFKTNYCVIYIDLIDLDMPWNLVRCRLLDYKDLRRRILQLAERYTRYQNHITFISNCIKQQKVPKGFRLKYHCNITNLEYENTIKKCSLKLIHRTASNYKSSILALKADFDKTLGKVNYFHSSRREALSREREQYEKVHIKSLLFVNERNTREIILMLERVICTIFT